MTSPQIARFERHHSLLGAVLGFGLGLLAAHGVVAWGTPGPAAAEVPANPVPYSKESVARGRALYVRHCPECHGANGKAQVDLVADATDLTDPDLWHGGTEVADIFTSIRDGAGIDMPPYSFTIRQEEDLWHLVNYVLSLWPEDRRPKPSSEESKPDDGPP